MDVPKADWGGMENRQISPNVKLFFQENEFSILAKYTSILIVITNCRKTDKNTTESQSGNHSTIGSSFGLKTYASYVKK
ncbi:hypothetical protein JCM16814_35560 [Desulfobaculum senezii]